MESLSFELKIASELAFNLFLLLNTTRTFPNLRTLHLKYSGSIINWIKYKHNPLNEKYFKIWEDIDIKELSYDISEINMTDEIIQVKFI